MDISVIIVNYNTCQVTKQCLDSIFKHTSGVDFEVIVVDNDSHDGSKEMLKNYPDIKYIQSGGNLGFGKANNLGYKQATGKYILLLNSDTYFLNNALKFFVDGFNQLDDNVGCVGSKLQFPDGSPNHSFQALPSLKRDFQILVELYLKPIDFHFNKFNERDYDDIDTFPVEYVIGADLCIRRTVIEKCGLFDPDFFMYYEESEMQYRYHKYGFSSYILSSPKIVHLDGFSSKRDSYRNRKMYYSSEILYKKKCYSPVQYYSYRICMFFRIPMFFASYYNFTESIKMIWFVLSYYPKK